MKIIVYAICKNESKFVHRWVQSMSEADNIYVLDTGSTDDTVKLLKKEGVIVKSEIINPWRFDTARNKSLDMVPLDADICVCTDLDEVFDKGWRKKLEGLVKDNDRVRYNYIWSFDKYNKPAVNFYQEKIHRRKGYTWVNPVHEILNCSLDNEKTITTDEITLMHYADQNKSRSSYLPLLELAVKENPNNDRNMHYLGREYMFYQRYEDAIDTLKKHLDMKEATWKDERCASCRYICRCYRYLKKYNESIDYGLLSIAEAPYLREPYLELAFTYYELKDYYRCAKYLELSLEIKNNVKTYINDPLCYNGTIEDLLGVCYFYLNDFEKSLRYSALALELNPNDERIKNNYKIILEKLR